MQNDPTNPADEQADASAGAPEETVATPTPEATPAEETTAAPAAEAPAAETPAPETPAEAPAAAGTLPELTLGSGAPAEEPAAAPVVRGRIDKHGAALGTGRRKTSVARVRIKTGQGTMIINGRSLEEYFCTERDREMIEAPLKATETYGKVDVWVRVNGGGTTGQAGAIVLGIARALQAMYPNLHEQLSVNGWLTRDGRMVERKKYGFKKARRSFQFSKR